VHRVLQNWENLPAKDDIFDTESMWSADECWNADVMLIWDVDWCKDALSSVITCRDTAAADEPQTCATKCDCNSCLRWLTTEFISYYKAMLGSKVNAQLKATAKQKHSSDRLQYPNPFCLQVHVKKRAWLCLTNIVEHLNLMSQRHRFASFCLEIVEWSVVTKTRITNKFFFVKYFSVLC